ncbi:MAG: choice-of-anchor D domain-containing protein, partial [Candidatus Thiodiazotropha sp. (ex Lucinoma borealis)]|nr:choice-of-anchor D domain-containing protein [Candidatus Thiodiazotropha sp. (ex Lucinoma borealis)]
MTPNTINFGTITVGSSSGAMSVTFTNNNTSGDILFSSISASGSFSITNNCPVLTPPLTAGTNCTVDVVFSPQSTGTNSGQLTFSGSDEGIAFTTTVALSGTGQLNLIGNLSIVPNALDFGSISVGSSSTTVPVTLSSSGNASVSISAITTAAPFAQTNDCPTLLSAGSSCTIMVSTTPTSAGTLSGSLTASGTGPQGAIDQSIPLSVLATAGELTISDTQLLFADSGVNTSSDPQVVTISNQGNAPLLINSITTEG